ncbi:MAG: zinc ribbon domain-containing protein [Blastocatellia bacterium]
MYCPNCGSDNQAGIKFCTRCGTNLEVVQDALTGKLSSTSKIDQKMVRLLQNYYRGRRGVMIGAPMALAGIIVQGIIFALGFPERLIPFMVLALVPLIYGFISRFLGIARWNSAGSELKALGYVIPQTSLPRVALPEKARTIGDYSTEPIRGPASVTEQTTRHLDKRARIEPPEHQ